MLSLGTVAVNVCDVIAFVLLGDWFMLSEPMP